MSGKEKIHTTYLLQQNTDISLVNKLFTEIEHRAELFTRVSKLHIAIILTFLTQTP